MPRRTVFFLFTIAVVQGFVQRNTNMWSCGPSKSATQGIFATTLSSVQEATAVLKECDQQYNPDNKKSTNGDNDSDPSSSKLQKEQIADAVRFLAIQAQRERELDQGKGRCMLGICASSAQEGVQALKSWVTALELPRGLLHGMDKDGVPIELNGGVYIKYNTGGSLTFNDIRKSGLGFDALWKPGDALVELYDGTYRGVYFQVELSDGEFRQFLVPLDIFSE